MKSKMAYPQFCVIFTFLSILNAVTLAALKKYKEMEILDDLPLKDDLPSYLEKLEGIMHFVDTHKNYLDMNLGFGLFLVNVNLKTVLKFRGSKLPRVLKTRLDRVLRTNDKMMKYFNDKVDKDTSNTETDESVRQITEHFINGGENWLNHLKMYKPDLIKETKFYSKRELNEMYPKWPEYMEKVYDVESYNPSPNISDSCISSLSENPINSKLRWTQCEVSSSCLQTVNTGTDFGYGITHRLLYLLMARFSRGCTIISALEDQRWINKFCAMIYNEAEFNANNNFQIPDLALEQICLCSLEGHVQFLRQSWFDELFGFQSELGCFASSVEGKNIKPSEDLYEVERPHWRVVNSDQDIMDGSCNTHTTGVAAAAISAAIRYIIEKHAFEY